MEAISRTKKKPVGPDQGPEAKGSRVNMSGQMVILDDTNRFIREQRAAFYEQLNRL